MPIVTLNNSKTFEVAPEVSILEAGQQQHIVLEHSCKTGRCGVCKTTVKAGATKVVQPETSLTEKDLAAGKILTCCRTVISDDVILDAEDLGLLAKIERKTLPCRIDSLDRIAPHVMRVVLRIPPNASFDYLEGQYIDLIRNDTRRSYSIANSSIASDKLELQIVEVPGGLMSKYIFEEAKVNDLLRLEGPLGTFCIRSYPEQHLIFIATGTGMAPIKAILEKLDSHESAIPVKSISVYWGGRNPSDFYWEPEFSNISISFTRTLSRPNDDWNGRIGYVQDLVKSDFGTLEGSAVYACGSETMIASARDLLHGAGLPEHSFHSDAFVQSS